MPDHIGIEDFSCEICQPLAYIDYIHRMLSDLERSKKDCATYKYLTPGSIVLSPEEVDAFSWMLGDAGVMIEKIKNAFYPDK